MQIFRHANPLRPVYRGTASILEIDVECDVDEFDVRATAVEDVVWNNAIILMQGDEIVLTDDEIEAAYSIAEHESRDRASEWIEERLREDGFTMGVLAQ